jgi:two-component system response regulator LytT
MLRIGICDDEAACRDRLRLELQKRLRQDDGAYFEFSSGEGVMGWVQKHPGELDLLLLDIEMRGIDGMEAARQIRRTDRDLLLVFVTGYDQYVFDGYQVDALGYLLKPVQPAQLDDVLRRARQRLEERAPEQYVIRNADGVYRLRRSEILYVSSDRRVVTAVTARGKFSFYAKLDDVAAELGDGFVRIHQRHLVNAQAVEAVEGDQVAVGGIRLPISRSCRAEAMMRLARAMTG